MKGCSVIAFALLGCFVFAGCKQKEDIVAKIGNEKITMSDFVERVDSTPPAYQAYINTEPGKKQFLDLLVREKLLLENAKQSGINKKDEYKQAIKDFSAEQKKQFKDYQDGLLMEMFLKELQSTSINPTEDEINKYYEDNKTDFTNPTAIVAKHILVQSKEDADTVLARIKSGESFDKVAQEMSTDRISAEKGGLIGPFRKGELVPEFEKAVFNLKTGEISDAIETPFGLHIITKVSEAKLPPISEDVAKSEIKKMLSKTKFENWFDDKKKSLNVTVDYTKLNTIKAKDVADNNEDEKDEILEKFSN
ncbi:MAG: peptidylprolyl isomerase [Endomicrobiaceae bacterium]|nr:peptidylprolyl isomerase [Endomicrobiaceae bacterium]